MKCQCQKCGYSWFARIEHPKCCPGCKSRAWKSRGLSAKSDFREDKKVFVEDVVLDYSEV
jgi:predicted Zn-ribbon and HTH transcriptional regulator